MEIHKAGQEGQVPKLPQDPEKIRATIVLRAKALMAAIVAKLKK